MLSAFAKCPSLLRNISKIEVEFWRPSFDPLPMTALVLGSLSSPSISEFLRNVSLMPQLHTVAFSGIKLQQRHLASLLRSNSLHHLIVSQCRLPRWVWLLPPSPIRHLTLSLSHSCGHVEPLLGHCGPNLETLDFNGYLSRPPGSTRLPLFPKLRELKIGGLFSISDLHTLISLAPQLEHLEYCGRKDFIHRLSALPASLNRFSINRWAMDDMYFDTRLFIHFPHLHITHFPDRSGAEGDRRGSVIPIIRRIFPNLTSLELTIQWDFRNLALLHARHLPNVTRLKLNISCPTVDDIDFGPYLPYFPALGGPLASLYVNVEYANEFHIETCKIWVIHTVLGPDPGLGGPCLQEVEVVFSNSRSFVVLETKKGWNKKWTYKKEGCIQSIQRNEERIVWVYSHGQVHEGPYVGDRDCR